MAATNAKLYANLAEGFLGTGLKKDEFICECSDLDDIIAFTRAGKLMVTRLGDKKFVGKDIIYVNVWKKNDERTAYNMAYHDGASKRTYVKRFNVTGITRDKEYDDLTQGTAGSKVIYFTTNPKNSESEIVEKVAIAIQIQRRVLKNLSLISGLLILRVGNQSVTFSPSSP